MTRQLSIVHTLCTVLCVSRSIQAVAGQACRLIPGDDGWPGPSIWTQLNSTVGGRLIATIPRSSVCHDSGYGSSVFNEAACDALKAEWDYPQPLSALPKQLRSPSVIASRER
jgi:hypothetical protein